LDELPEPVGSPDATPAISGGCVLFAITSPNGVSRTVLAKAIRLAAATGSELKLFYRAFDSDVIHPPRPTHHRPEDDIRTYVEQRYKVLSALAEETLRATGLKVSVHVEWDSRSDEGILEEVSGRHPVLVVMESFPKTEADGVLAGQTHHKLIEICPCPLLLVRSACTYPAHPRVLAAVDPMRAHAKPAELDDAIVSAASWIAGALTGELHLFHARTPWATASHRIRGPRWIPDVTKDESQVDYEHFVQSRVAELASRHDLSSMRVHLVDGDVRHCLPLFSRTDAIDIVAVGAVSRPALQRMLIGDNMPGLVDELECDVLIVKQPGYDASAAAV